MNNEEFFEVVRKYLNENMENFNKFKLIKMLDIFKYSQYFQDQDIKMKLANLIEAKDGERLNESEEEELKHMNEEEEW